MVVISTADDLQQSLGRNVRIPTDERRRQRDALEARPIPARSGCQRVGRKRRVADTGATTNTSRGEAGFG